MGDILGGADKAKKAQREQEAALQKQRRAEETRLAESRSEIARRKATAAARGGGRSLLVQTSPTGTTQTLGGG